MACGTNKNRMCILAAIAAVGLVLRAAPVVAQIPPFAQGPHAGRGGRAQPGGRMPGRFPGAPQLPRLEASGQVDAVAGNFIRMVASGGQVWTLRVAANARLELEGTMKPELIQPGQYIRFTGTVDHQTNQVEEKLSRITIFTPNRDNPDTQLGAFPEQPEVPAEGNDPFAQPQGAGNPFAQPLGGVQGATQAGGVRGRLSRGSRRSRLRSRASHGRSGETPAPTKGTYDIRGQIREIARDGTLTVYVPNRFFRPAIKLSLADDVQIAVQLSGPVVLGLIAKGDRIEARGVQVAPTAAEVSEVRIEKLEPIGPQQTTRRAVGARSARHGAARGGRSEQVSSGDREQQSEASSPRQQTAEQPGQAADQADQPADKNDQTPGGIDRQTGS